MEIIFSAQFKKRFKKIPVKIQNKFEERIEIFLKDYTNPLLKIHPLKGNFFGFHAFSVTCDYRVMMKIINKKTIKLVDIGTHNQVY